jgi:hypothetical protein
MTEIFHIKFRTFFYITSEIPVTVVLEFSLQDIGLFNETVHFFNIILLIVALCSGSLALHLAQAVFRLGATPKLICQNTCRHWQSSRAIRRLQ